VLLLLIQPQAQFLVAIDRIAHDPLGEHASGQGAGKHAPGEFSLRGEAHLIRDADLPAANPIRCPFFWQVEGAIQKGRATAGRIEQKHPNLAVLPPPSGATVLPGDSGGFLPFLDKACLIHDENPLLLPQMLHHIGLQGIPHGFFIPVGLAQQSLHPTRAVFAQRFSHLPTIFAFQGREQALEVASCSRSRLGAAKVRPNACLHLSQFFCDPRQPVSWSRVLFGVQSFQGHLLPLLEAVYHFAHLTVTVVLDNSGTQKGNGKVVVDKDRYATVVKSKTVRSGKADFLLRVIEGLVADRLQRGGEAGKSRAFLGSVRTPQAIFSLRSSSCSQPK
jgi:hypothetical protein